MIASASNWVDFSAVKRAVSLEAVLGHYRVRGLRRRGDQLQGCCPIHRGRRDDSFRAHLTRNVFHCFACQARGNVLDFVASMERCSIREAAFRLQQGFGVSAAGAMDRQNRELVRKEEGRKGMSANTVLHNIIIVAQFFRRYGRAASPENCKLPQKISTLPVEYSEEDLLKFIGACDAWEQALFSTFLLTGVREQEVEHLFWTDINIRLRTIRVTAKSDRVFYPKRWEEREIPVPTQLVEVLERHPKFSGSPFVFPIAHRQPRTAHARPL